MSVKARLTIAVVAVLVVATGVLGYAMVSSTRSSLIGQIDDLLRASRTRPPPPDPRRRDPQLNRYRSVAEIVYEPDGTLLKADAVGFADDQLPLPAIPRVPSRAFDRLRDHVVTLGARGDAGFDYRVLVFQDRQGNLHVFAAPLEPVDDAVSDLLRTFGFTALGVLLLGGLVSWFLIRRGMRPVDRMIGTASAIADGDLSQRIDHRDDRSELGRLATALDDMLGQLESAFDQREAARKRLEQFVADASHELRTPVAAIRGYAELYRAGGIADGEQLDRAMTRVERESIRVQALVEDLLTLARLDEQQPLERERVDLSALATDAASDLRAVDPSREVTVDAPAPVIVRGDESRLRQVLANLLTNARIHTPAGTAVHLSVAEIGGDARLVVSDEGPGIDDADRQRIFERFVRTDKSRSRERGGSGLGLSIVAAVVGAHGGRVDVGRGSAGGAAFTVVLPREPARTTGPVPGTAPPEPARSPG